MQIPGKTFLIASNDQLFLNLLSVTLQRIGGTVVSASKVEDVANAILAHKPDLIIIDTTMAKRTEDSVKTDIPAILLTSQNETVARSVAAKIGLTQPKSILIAPHGREALLKAIADV